MAKKKKKKRKRRRPSAGGTARQAPVEVVSEDEAPEEEAEPTRRERGRLFRLPGQTGSRTERTQPATEPGAPPPRLFAPGPWPPLGVSLAAGFRAAGRSPAILATAFLSALAMWGFFVSAGIDASPGFMVGQMAISPVHVFFDIDVAFLVAPESWLTLAVVVALGLLRAASFTLLIALLDGSLRQRRWDRAAFLRTLSQGGLSLFAIYVAEFALVVTVTRFLLGALAAQFGVFLVIIGLHFLAFVPVAAVVEGVTAREALRRGYRAARLPGIRHILFALVYFVFVIYAISAVQGTGLFPVTPSLATWGFVLLATFIHAGAQGALVYRWHVVREATEQAPARPARR